MSIDAATTRAVLDDDATFAPPHGYDPSFSASCLLDVATWQLVSAVNDKFRLAVCEECGRPFLHRRNRAWLCPEHGDVTARARRLREGRAHPRATKEEQP